MKDEGNIVKLRARDLPFSAYGSYFSVITEENGLAILDLHGGDRVKQEIYHLAFKEDVTVTLYPTRLELSAEGGKGCFVIDENGDLWLELKDMSVTLSTENEKYNTLLEIRSDYLEHIFYSKERRIGIFCLSGVSKTYQHWSGLASKDIEIVLGGKGRHVFKFSSFKAVAPVLRLEEREKTYFEQLLCRQEERYGIWRESLLGDIDYHKMAETAIYLLWVNMVKAEGQLFADSNYCSKRHMNNSWSWDFCFVAIALAKRFPEISYRQFAVFMEKQAPEGCYPDYINEEYASYSCTKPPIQTWMYSKMMKENPYFLDKKRLSIAYESLKKMVFYWLTYRADEEGLPYYFHGNDSGWDNSSIFITAPPIQTPDLSAYLLREMKHLAKIADILENEEGQLWEEKINSLSTIFYERLRSGNFFCAKDGKTKKLIQEKKRNSLSLFLPLVLGESLPKEMAVAMVRELKERFLCPYGLATEAPDSPHYKKGGYWLGPIWAPVTYLLIDALRSLGEKAFADELRERFLNLVEVGQMSENFDAYSGEGFDDKGFSWTAAVYYQLCKENRKDKIK